MDSEFVTLQDLQERHSDFAYRRLNRAVGCLRQAGVIQPWRGKHNEIRMSPSHALLVDRLADLMRRDFGIQKAIAFLQAEIAQDRVKELESVIARLSRTNRDLEEKCRAAGLGIDDVSSSAT